MAFCPVCLADYPEDWKRCPKDESALLRSRTIGKYRVDGVIGRGGMGAVYRAYNPDTASDVAIKVLHASTSDQEDARRRFQREAAAVANLRTRHVVTIYDFGADSDGTPYLVMELLKGRTLRRELGAEALPLARVHVLLDGILRGLASAHRAGITHRDLKPDNIFLADTDDGEVVKILDFGIARVERDRAGLTQSGALLGTPAYMAPEQVAGDRDRIGPWTDVYALGVILYEMLAGTIPFAGDNVTEILRRVLARELRPLATACPTLPPRICAVIDRALASEPKARPASADALRDAWEQAHQPFAAATPSESRRRSVAPHDTVGADVLADTQVHDSAPLTDRPPPVTPQTGARPAGRWPLYAGIAGVLVVGAAIAVPLALRRPGHAPGVLDASPPRPIDAAVEGASLAPDAAPAPVPADMARLAGGRVRVGVEAGASDSPDADPAHDVDVAPFLLDRTEVTWRAYGHAPAGVSLDEPARAVTWDEADAYCRALGKRLPTEAEWEHAATRAPLAGARLKGPGVSGPDRVGQHSGDCSPEGVCDLLGNVAEWTADRWRQAGQLDPDPQARAVRGGSFQVAPTEPFYASPKARARMGQGEKDPEVGFRCAR
jgi:eukaryotic-like serine/threonine-protein kinase